MNDKRTSKDLETSTPRDPNAPLSDDDLAKVTGGAGASTGAGAGKVSFHDISITKQIDKSSAS
jgi:hypothetical protein